MDWPNQLFLEQTLPNLLRTLPADQAPNFGLMTAQHMVEHLIWTTKIFIRQADRPADWSEESGSVQGFRRFVAKGCPFEYRPKEGATQADLSPLRCGDMEEAIDKLEAAIAELYGYGAADANYLSFNPMTGAFNMQQLDLLISQHCRWHAYQFGLLADFQPLPMAASADAG